MTLLVANHVDDIRRIRCVEDREAFGQPERARVAPERPVGNRVERPSHHSARGRGCATVETRNTEE